MTFPRMVNAVCVQRVGYILGAQFDMASFWHIFLSFFSDVSWPFVPTRTLISRVYDERCRAMLH